MTNICKCQESFEEVSRLREAINEEFSELPLIIVGNKIDLAIDLGNFTFSEESPIQRHNFVITTMNCKNSG